MSLVVFAPGSAKGFTSSGSSPREREGGDGGGDGIPVGGGVPVGGGLGTGFGGCATGVEIGLILFSMSIDISLTSLKFLIKSCLTLFL